MVLVTFRGLCHQCLRSGFLEPHKDARPANFAASSQGSLGITIALWKLGRIVPRRKEDDTDIIPLCQGAHAPHRWPFPLFTLSHWEAGGARTVDIKWAITALTWHGTHVPTAPMGPEPANQADSSHNPGIS